jgi:hypothetical protein
MKSRILVFATICFGLTWAAHAANYTDLAAQGYRWITVDGPYACPTEQDLQRITSHRTDAVELQMIENLQAYYLIPGTLVQVVKDNPATGMSQIRLGGITSDLWTYTKFLSKRPIADPYGVIENPENSGLIPTATTGMDPVSGQSEATPTLSASPIPSVSPTTHSRSKKIMRETTSRNEN